MPLDSHVLERLSNNDPTLIQLDLSYQRIGNAGVKALARALKDNRTLLQLNLSFNEIDAEGANDLARVLKDHRTLQQLNLSWNRIGDAGANAFALALQDNAALTRLDLSLNTIGPAGTKALALALKDNHTLKRLDLQDNQVGDEGANELAVLLHDNHTLNQLNLLRNQIHDVGAQALALALKNNYTLIRLELGFNEISTVGANELASMLVDNHTLSRLDLRGNPLGEEGVQALALALNDNHTLTRLDLSGNELGKVGAEARQAIETSLARNHHQRQQQAQAHFTQGQACLDQGRDFEALLHFQQALNWNPYDKVIEAARQPVQTRCGLLDTLPPHPDLPELIERLLQACQAASAKSIDLASQSQQLEALTAPASVLYQGTGYTALHVAAIVGPPTLVKSLLAQGHDVHAALKRTGQTPLHLAVQACQQENANALIRNGASLTRPDTRGQTPQQLIAQSPLNHRQRWSETARYLAYAYQQDQRFQQLRQTEASRLAHAQTFVEEQLALHAGLKAMSDEDPLSRYRTQARQLLDQVQATLSSKLYEACLAPLQTLTYPALLLKQENDYSFFDKVKMQGSSFNLQHPVVSVRSAIKLQPVDLSPQHPMLSAIRHLQKRLTRLCQRLAMANQDALAAVYQQLADYYGAYITAVCQATPEAHALLCRPPMQLHVVGMAPRLLHADAHALFAQAATQRREEGDAATGTSLVKVFRGIHFKRDPYAPGVEFMVGALGQLLMGRGITPSELLKVVDTAGFPIAYLASKTVAGVELGHIIRERPADLTRIQPDNFSAMVVLSLLIDPQDGKPDNYMVELETDERGELQSLAIIGIDNDIAFGEPRCYFHTSGPFKNQPFVTVKNVLYFFPQMQAPITASFCQRFLSLEPAMLLLEWLQALDNQNRCYQQLLDEGVFTVEEFQGSKIRPHGLKLPLRFRPGTVARLYQKLCSLQDYLHDHPTATHAALFERLEPELYQHYRRVQHQHAADIMQCIHQLYLEQRSDEAKREQLARQIHSQQTEALTQSVLTSVELRHLETQQTQTMEDALLELLAAVAYQRLDAANTQLWYQQLVTFPLASRFTDPAHLYQAVLHRGLRSESLLTHLLTQRNLSPNARYPGGDTALHLAVQHGRHEWAALLLAHGANVNSVNEAGYTPLHIAASRNDNALLALLLKAEAERDPVQLKTGETPLDKALNHGHEAAAKLLLAHGAHDCLPKHQARVKALRARLQPAATYEQPQAWVAPPSPPLAKLVARQGLMGHRRSCLTVGPATANSSSPMPEQEPEDNRLHSSTTP